MAIEIRPLHPVFVGEVSGADLTKPLTRQEVAAIEAGMDRYAVLVLHGQDITDEQQIAYSRNFGEIELAVGSNVTKLEDRRLRLEIADVSNLDQNNQVFARDDRRRMFNLGNQLWHSDSSFRAVPAKYSLLSGRRVQTGQPHDGVAEKFMHVAPVRQFGDGGVGNQRHLVDAHTAQQRQRMAFAAQRQQRRQRQGQQQRP